MVHGSLFWAWVLGRSASPVPAESNRQLRPTSYFDDQQNGEINTSLACREPIACAVESLVVRIFDPNPRATRAKHSAPRGTRPNGHRRVVGLSSTQASVVRCVSRSTRVGIQAHRKDHPACPRVAASRLGEPGLVRHEIDQSARRLRSSWPPRANREPLGFERSGRR
jgi:hypothetical protein